MSLLACVHMPIQSFVITLIFNVFRVLHFINREYMILDFKYTTTHVYLWINKYFVIHKALQQKYKWNTRKEHKGLT